ncbi:helicase-related protein [Azospirillum sp. TSO22-1]|uniref:helicase-related protein n=1 Tax=Azospirillum sp. TSO22-1 TaxID=716789 RepID=UPI000D61FB87|nr:helicase-related protein [Azospirillum sp. TSO22-1]PWC32060.1 hypothetical protein TSO221_31580 [Azospirillum sp. TSO22-1]
MTPPAYPNRDEAIELKEAVVDALLGLTYARCAGEAEFGEVIYGALPSRKLVTGFLLPRFNAAGVDDTTDIRIAAHGMDFQVDRALAKFLVRPRLSVYVRLLPTADDLFSPDAARRWDLLPRTRLKPEIERAIVRRIRERMTATKPAEREGSAAYRERRNAITVDVMCNEFNIRLRDANDGNGDASPADDVAVGDGALDDGIVEGGEANAGAAQSTDAQEEAPAQENGIAERTARLTIGGSGHVIPDDLAVGEPTPFKWKRLEIATEPFEADLTDPNFGSHLDAYNERLVGWVTAAIANWTQTEEGRLWGWRKGLLKPSDYRDQTSWNGWLDQVRRRLPNPDPLDLNPGLVPFLDVDAAPDPFDPDRLNVRVALENQTSLPDPRQAVDREFGLFQTGVQVALPPGVLLQMSMERVKPSYHLAGYLSQPAIGVNGGVIHDVRTGDGLEVLDSTWMPRWVQPRIVPNDVPGVVVDYETLSTDAETGLDGLDVLVSAMEDWIDGPQGIVHLDPTEGIPPEDAAARDRERNRLDRDLRAWRDECAAIRRGALLLRRSRAVYVTDPAAPRAFPFRAWLALNRTFANAGRSKGHTTWRLFQMAFVVAHIPCLASRMPEFQGPDPEWNFYHPEHEGRATLLYFSTGGGKSEAFFGVLIFALFLDRLRGKRRGITALIRYPLRLLTLQQSQRLARTLTHAELVRRSIPDIAGTDCAPFEIGFWVGSSNTPNRTMSGSSVIDDLRSIPPVTDTRSEAALRTVPGYVERSLAYNKLPVCPFCGSQTVLRLFPAQANRLGIVCTNADDCAWNAAHAAPEALPFLLVDSDIYRRAPAVLLGTVDKLAMIGNHQSTINKITGMFGLARWYDPTSGLLESPDDPDTLREPPPRGLRRVRPAYDVDADEIFHDPFPSICIQDEGHLLEESLGTFSALFETTLTTWFRYLAGLLGNRVARVPGSGEPRMPKIIAASATVSDADRQIGTLYQKEVAQFPHPGPRLYRSFYARLATLGDPARAALSSRLLDQEVLAPWMRVYVSLMTNGRPHTTTTVAVLARFHLCITTLLRDLLDPVRAPAVYALMERFQSEGLLRDRHVAALRGAQAHGRMDLLAELVDLHRIALTYVTNKKGGDQLLAAMVGEVQAVHREADSPIYALLTELISGGVDAATIQAIMKRAENSPPVGTRPLDELLRGIVATSAISHGVDVEQFNSMFFAGLPSDIAEYIQASSRVGRTHVGFSMLIPTPQARRDRYVVEVHAAFHRFLERMIAPPAVERWADRAIQRVIPSLFQNWLVGCLYQRSFKEKPEGSKHLARRFYRIEAIVNEMAELGRDEFVRRAVAHIVDAIAVDGPQWPAGDPGYYRNIVAREVQNIVNEVDSGNFNQAELHRFWKASQALPFAPMTSLRDVDQGGLIVPARRSARARPISSDEINDIMAFIRNGGDSGSDASEMDDDEGRE